MKRFDLIENQGYHHQMHRSGKHVLSLQREPTNSVAIGKLNVRKGLRLIALYADM
jgi:hypothetical protein